MDDEVLMARVYISEADHGRRNTLMREVLNTLHDRQCGVHGVVVFRGIAGFGADGEVHASDMLRLNVDLPVVLEFFDTAETVRLAVALLDDLIPDGHIVTWPVSRHRKAQPQRT